MNRYDETGKVKRHFLLQSDIEEAMRHTKSNRAAAMYLKVNYLTYRKYARMYYDKEGNNLFEKHKNQSTKGIKKAYLNYKGTRCKSLDDIFAGKHPKFKLVKLKYRLINNGYLQEKCNLCGFEEKRITDYKSPLLLHQIDGDETNYKFENLELLCYNCYFLTVGNIIGKKYSENTK